MKFYKPNRNLEKEEVIAYVDADGAFNYKSPTGWHYIWTKSGKIITDFEYNTWNPPMDDEDAQLFSYGDKVEIQL